MRLLFVTSNTDKFKEAQRGLLKHGIEVVKWDGWLKEIQAQSAQEVILDKLEQVEMVNPPAMVSDHEWGILALNNFPGPFAKYINAWFEGKDWLRLMEGKQNKTIFKKEFFGVTKEDSAYRVFSRVTAGKFRNKLNTKEKLSLMQAIDLESVSDNIWEEIASYLKE